MSTKAPEEAIRRWIGCELREADPYLVPRGAHTTGENTKRYLKESKDTFKLFMMNALAFIAAQAVQSFAQAILNTVYPMEENKGWSYVLSQGIYMIITFVLAVMIGFLWNLGERQAKKRWEFLCSTAVI